MAARRNNCVPEIWLLLIGVNAIIEREESRKTNEEINSIKCRTYGVVCENANLLIKSAHLFPFLVPFFSFVYFFRRDSRNRNKREIFEIVQIFLGNCTCGTYSDFFVLEAFL